MDRNHQRCRETLSVAQLRPLRPKKKALERSESTFFRIRIATIPQRPSADFSIIGANFVEVRCVIVAVAKRKLAGNFN